MVPPPRGDRQRLWRHSRHILPLLYAWPSCRGIIHKDENILSSKRHRRSSPAALHSAFPREALAKKRSSCDTAPSSEKSMLEILSNLPAFMPTRISLGRRSCSPFLSPSLCTGPSHLPSHPAEPGNVPAAAPGRAAIGNKHSSGLPFIKMPSSGLKCVIRSFCHSVLYLKFSADDIFKKMTRGKGAVRSNHHLCFRAPRFSTTFHHFGKCRSSPPVKHLAFSEMIKEP